MAGDDNAPVRLSPTALAYDHFLLDLDGCVWVGDEGVPGAAEALNALRAVGKRVVFVTNDPRHTAEQYVIKLWRLGFQAAAEEVVTVGAALERLLSESFRPRNAFVIGTRALVDHVALAGMRIVNATSLAPHADLVVLGGHERFDYAELRTAIQAVSRGAQLVGTTRDATFPMPDGPWPGTGSLLAAVEAGTGRQADYIVGKPEPAMYEAARARLGPGRVLAVGDRMDIDVAGAQAAGLDSALVLTGACIESDARRSASPPTYIGSSLTHLLSAAADTQSTLGEVA